MGADRPGRLRIVAGNWRSRVLPVAAVEGLRPTSERVRETLFNWLGPRIVGQRALDLFAGSGALGFEALSRGASDVVFVERSTRAVAALREAASLLDASGADIRNDDANRYLNACEPDSFDLVFLDPPFADDSLTELCRLISDKRIVRRGGRVYIEQDRQANEAVLPGGWELLKSKTAGNVRYSLVSVQGEQCQ